MIQGGHEITSTPLDPNPEVNVVPASPEMSDEENSTVPEIVPVFKSPERRATRLQARTSPQKSPEPRSSTSSQSSSGGSRTKRRIVESSPETSPTKIEPQVVTKKQKTKPGQNSNDSESLLQKAEKVLLITLC